MITTVIISALSVLVVILGFTTFNLDQAIEESDKHLKKIDEKGFFRSDDEIGWFFEQVKTLQSILNEFRVKNL